MKVIELKNITYKNSQIVYIRQFDCDAIVELMAVTETIPLHFEIEIDCFGNRNIRMDLKKEINYPLLPLKKNLSEYIKNQDEEGKLPC